MKHFKAKKKYSRGNEMNIGNKVTILFWL